MFKKLQYNFSTMIKYRRQDLVVVVFAIILLSIIVCIVIILSSSHTPTTTSAGTTPSITVSPSVTPLPYNAAAGSRLAQKLLNRKALSQQDTAVKDTTLNTILHGYNSGVVYKTPDVQIEYMQSLDIFMAEILTPNIANAKTEANAWFINQGFSQQAICNLPVMFYLSPEVNQQLQGTSVVFSPLPDNC